MDEILAAAKRHLAALEARIARQTALIDSLQRTGGDTTQAMYNRALMEHALESMRATLQELVGSDAARTGGETVGKRKRRSGRRPLGLED